MKKFHATPVVERIRAAVLPVVHDFTATYDLYKDAIVRYCRFKCRDNAVSEELAQETFLRFWLCTERNEPILFVRAFLYRIAHNLVIDHVRRKKEASLDQLLEAGFEPAVDLWQQTYSRLDVERPLKKLSQMRKPFRKVLEERFLHELTPMEISAKTGESSNTISVRISRGLTHLRVLLRDNSAFPLLTRI